MPKRTYQPNTKKKKKNQGFRARMGSQGGRKVIKRRIQRKRKKLTS